MCRMVHGGLDGSHKTVAAWYDMKNQYVGSSPEWVTHWMPLPLGPEEYEEACKFLSDPKRKEQFPLCGYQSSTDSQSPTDQSTSGTQQADG